MERICISTHKELLWGKLHCQLAAYVRITSGRLIIGGERLILPLLISPRALSFSQRHLFSGCASTFTAVCNFFILTKMSLLPFIDVSWSAYGVQAQATQLSILALRCSGCSSLDILVLP